MSCPDPYRILTGGALEQLATEGLGGTVQCVVTSPPYWQMRDYGVDGQLGLEQTIDEHLDALSEVFSAVHRVLADDGVLWLNYGDAHAHDKSWGGGSSGLRFGRSVGANPPRNKKNSGLKHKDLMGLPWRLAFRLQADGWYLRSEIIWAKPNPMPESIKDRPTRSHEQLFMLTKEPTYFYDSDAIKERGVIPAGTRFAKGSVDRGGARGVNGRPAEYAIASGFRNKRDVWWVETQPFPVWLKEWAKAQGIEAHYAAFPEALVEPCILAASRRGDLVLDPFCGSGTVGAVALKHGRRFLGVELNPGYVRIAHKRMEQWANQLHLSLDPK